MTRFTIFTSLLFLLPLAGFSSVIAAQSPYCIAEDAQLTPVALSGFESYGRGVATDGARAVVGASLSRRVTIFSRDLLDWTEEVTLQPMSAGAGWGTTVALSGDTLVVGAPYDTTDGVDAGSVTVFSFDGNAWVEVATLTPAAGLAGRRFGTSLSLDGNRLAVGAPGDEVRTVGGEVVLFEEIAGVWTETDTILATSGSVGGFGSSVALVQTGALVGPTANLLVGSPDADTVHTYSEDLGAWTEGASLFGAGVDTGLGFALDADGTRAVIGAPFDDTAGENIGAVHVYELAGGSWVLSATQYASDAVNKDGLGVSVALDGDFFAVGAAGAPSGGSAGTVLASGHAYLFALRQGAWQEQSRLERSNGQSGDFFASSIDIFHDIVVVGIPGADDQGLLSGAAMTFRTGASVSNYGSGLAGTGGFIPSISLSSCAAVNQSFDIVIEGGVGGGLGLIIWSDSAGLVPFVGGQLLVGFPLFNQIAHQLGGMPGVGGEGSINFPVQINNEGIFGQAIFMQAGYLDAAAPAEVSLSTAFELHFPSY